MGVALFDFVFLFDPGALIQWKDAQATGAIACDTLPVVMPSLQATNVEVCHVPLSVASFVSGV